MVVGFGGYVAVPAYLAAQGIFHRGARVPVVVHEANARAGLANRLGARIARRVLAAVPDSRAGARPRWSACRCGPRSPAWTGPALRAEARAHFGFADDARVLLVFGGSQGAASINRAVSAAAADLAAAGIVGAARARAEEHPGPARAPARRSALRRGALPQPDGSRLRGSRSGDLPLRGDDGGRGLGRRVCPPSTFRCRSATANSGSMRCRWSTAGGGLLVADAELTRDLRRRRGGAVAHRRGPTGRR